MANFSLYTMTPYSCGQSNLFKSSHTHSLSVSLTFLPFSFSFLFYLAGFISLPHSLFHLLIYSCLHHHFSSSTLIISCCPLHATAAATPAIFTISNIASPFLTSEFAVSVHYYSTCCYLTERKELSEHSHGQIHCIIIIIIIGPPDGPNCQC